MNWIDRRIRLGHFPTPVFEAGRLRPGLWIKDDGCCHPLVAGNKVRKLEYLLAGGSEPVVTMGAVGSHHVLATAVHARQIGRSVSGVVFARPYDAHAARVLQATLPLASLEFVSNHVQAEKKLKRLVTGATVIPAGGSSAIGALGFVHAGLETAGLAQCPMRTSFRANVPTGAKQQWRRQWKSP